MLTKIIRDAHRAFAGRNRLLPLIFSLLVFWSGIDSQFFQLVDAETLPLPVPSPLSYSDDSDDDEMIELTDTRAPFQVNRKKDAYSLPQDLQKGDFSDLSSCQFSRLPAPTKGVCEPDCRDDFETPLRC